MGLAAKGPWGHLADSEFDLAAIEKKLRTTCSLGPLHLAASCWQHCVRFDRPELNPNHLFTGEFVNFKRLVKWKHFSPHTVFSFTDYSRVIPTKHFACYSTAVFWFRNPAAWMRWGVWRRKFHGWIILRFPLLPIIPNLRVRVALTTCCSRVIWG